MFAGVFHQGPHAVAGKPFQQTAFDRAQVHPHPDGDVVFDGGAGDLGYLLAAADIARIDADTVGATFDGGQCQTVVKMDVRDDREARLVLDRLEGRGGFPVRDTHPHDLAARPRQGLDLPHGGTHVAREGVGHGLDTHRGTAPHGDVSDIDTMGTITVKYHGK